MKPYTKKTLPDFDDGMLDLPIKAKTLKKKLEKKAEEEYDYYENLNKRDDDAISYMNEIPLQNNKPSIELIEKLDLQEQENIVWDLQIQDKINEIIDAVNELKTRINLIDKEDYE